VLHEEQTSLTDAESDRTFRIRPVVRTLRALGAPRATLSGANPTAHLPGDMNASATSRWKPSPGSVTRASTKTVVPREALEAACW